MSLRTLTIAQAVAETGMTAEALYSLLKQGKVRGNRDGGRGVWRIHQDSLEEWIVGPGAAAKKAPGLDPDDRRRWPEAEDNPLF